jgi:prepilin-type N-terminal cleavage/methylation domain-containing protein
MLLSLKMRQNALPIANNRWTKVTDERNGVTLIEVVLVVMILASAAVATSFKIDSQWMARRESRASTYDVSRLISLARNTAIEKQTSVRVSYVGRLGSTQINIVENPGPLTAGRSWSAPISSLASLQGVPSSFQFQADGSANSAVQWNVASNGVQGEITVSPVGGTIQTKAP